MTIGDRPIRHLLAVALGAVLAAAAPALGMAWPGPTWVGAYYSVGQSGRSADFLDRAAIGDFGGEVGGPRGGLKRAAMVTVYADEQTIDEASSPYVITTTGLLFDCQQPRYQITGIAFYNHAGDQLYTQDGDRDFSEIKASGSPIDQMRNLVCALTPWPTQPYLQGTMSALRRGWMRTVR